MFILPFVFVSSPIEPPQELVEKRAEATSEAQDIVTSTAILSTVLFSDGTVEPFSTSS
jgi:hypothetical protein